MLGLASNEDISQVSRTMCNSSFNSLAKAIANVAIFFEYAADDLIEPDAAMQVMEQFASDLKRMKDVDRSALVKSLREVSLDYETASHRDFIFGLPGTFGLD